MTAIGVVCRCVVTPIKRYSCKHLVEQVRWSHSPAGGHLWFTWVICNCGQGLGGYRHSIGNERRSDKTL